MEGLRKTIVCMVVGLAVIHTHTADAQEFPADEMGILTSLIKPDGDFRELAGQGMGLDLFYRKYITGSFAGKISVGYHQFGEKILNRVSTTNGAFITYQLGMEVYMLQYKKGRFFTFLDCGWYLDLGAFSNELLRGEKNAFGFKPGIGVHYMPDKEVNYDFSISMVMIPADYLTYGEEVCYQEGRKKYSIWPEIDLHGKNYIKLNFGITFNVFGRN